MKTNQTLKIRKLFTVCLLLLIVLGSSGNFVPQANATTIARVQGNCRGTSTSTTISVTMTTTPTSGNTEIAVIGTRSNTAYVTVLSIVQTGVTWSQIIYKSGGSFGARAEIWMGVIGASASTSITITLSSTPTASVVDVCEYSGITTSPIDKTSTNSGNSGSPNTGTTATTSQDDELWVGATWTSDGVQSSPTNGFTLLDGSNLPTYLGSLAYLEKIVSATGTANSGTSAGSAYWAGCIATFKASTSSTPTASNIGTSSTVKGTSCIFRTLFGAGVGNGNLSKALFATNNTGAWVTDSLYSFSPNDSTDKWYNVTKTLNSGLVTVAWWMWANTTTGAYKNTTTQTFQTTNTISVTPLAVNSTIANSYCQLQATFTTYSGTLSKYQFRVKNIVSWSNDTYTAFPESQTTYTVSKVIVVSNNPVSNVYWEVWGNNTIPEMVATTTQSFTITSQQYEGWLHTDGKYIKDEAGQVVQLTGSATLGMQQLFGSPPHTIQWNTDCQTQALYNALEWSGSNTVRVTVNYALAYESIVGSGTYNYPTYIQTLDSIVSYTESHGLWIIWDFHNDYYNGQLWGIGGGSAAIVIADATWRAEKITRVQTFANRYKNSPSVIGIEIWNEPNIPSGCSWDGYSEPARQTFFTTYRNWAQAMASAIHNVEPHYLVFVDSIQTGTTNVDWTYNGNQLLTEPNIVYAYHYYNWHFGSTDTFVQNYIAGNYVTGKANMISKYQQRFWFLRDDYNVPIWYGEFGFWDADVGGGTNLQQLIKDVLQVHNDRGISWNLWGCHTAMGESIVKQYSGTPQQIFNWKGLLMVDYTSGNAPPPPPEVINPPSYASMSYSTTVGSMACNFTIHFYQTGEATLSNSYFWWNGTGTGTNTTVAVSGTDDWVDIIKTLPASGFVSSRWYVVNSVGNWTTTSTTTFEVTTVANRWFLQWHHIDLDGNYVDSDISWKIYNATTELSYTKGQPTLLDGSYTLETYYQDILIGTKILDTSIYGNNTGYIDVYLNMKPLTVGYIALNDSVISFSWLGQTTTQKIFHIIAPPTGIIIYKIIVDTQSNATTVKNDGTALAYESDWIWNGTKGCLEITISTMSLSTWEIYWNIDFASTDLGIYNTQLYSSNNPYITTCNGTIGALTFSNNILNFMVSASSGQTSTTEVYVGDKGEPSNVDGATSWSYDNSTKIVTVSKIHSSSATITMTWGGGGLSITYTLTVIVQSQYGVVSNAKVTLSNALNMPISTKYADANGLAQFTDLAMGTYYVSAEDDRYGVALQKIYVSMNQQVKLTLTKPSTPTFKPLKIPSTPEEWVTAVGDVGFSIIGFLFSNLLSIGFALIGLGTIYYGRSEDEDGAIIIGVVLLAFGIIIYLFTIGIFTSSF